MERVSLEDVAHDISAVLPRVTCNPILLVTAGVETAVLISPAEYQKMSTRSHPYNAKEGLLGMCSGFPFPDLEASVTKLLEFTETTGTTQGDEIVVKILSTCLLSLSPRAPKKLSRSRAFIRDFGSYRFLYQYSREEVCLFVKDTSQPSRSLTLRLQVDGPLVDE